MKKIAIEKQLLQNKIKRERRKNKKNEINELAKIEANQKDACFMSNMYTDINYDKSTETKRALSKVFKKRKGKPKLATEGILGGAMDEPPTKKKRENEIVFCGRTNL